MIFAAGLGTRLRPITDQIPKAMVPVGGKPMLQIVIERCMHAGIKDIILNVHYLPEVILQFLESQENFGINIQISDETDALLETGGGLWKAKEFFKDGEPFLVANADVLTNIDIQAFRNYHDQHQCIATLAVRDRPGSRKLLFDQNGRLTGRSTLGETTKQSAFAFSGYHIIDPEIFKYPTREGKFSITDWYLDICHQHTIVAYRHDQDIWVDIGSIEKLQEAERIFEEETFI